MTDTFNEAVHSDQRSSRWQVLAVIVSALLAAAILVAVAVDTLPPAQELVATPS